jgi:hypothetical protein
MVLKHAETVLTERQHSYGNAAVSMAAVAARWSITLGQPVTPEQVVLCLIDLKPSHDPQHYDSAVDLAGYAALLSEVTQ